MRIYLASANPHKAAELRAMAADFGRGGAPSRIEVVSAAEAGGMPSVVEDTGTFVGNAWKKALALKAVLPAGGWAMADDSGICVDALGGAPGVDSAYFAGPASDAAANLALLVERMRGVPDGSRGAHYVCILALAGPDGAQTQFEGLCQGTLAREPRGAGGFGYDPLFIPEGYAVTMAELPGAVKNRISHRGRAWAACVGWLAARA